MTDDEHRPILPPGDLNFPSEEEGRRYENAVDLVDEVIGIFSRVIGQAQAPGDADEKDRLITEGRSFGRERERLKPWDADEIERIRSEYPDLIARLRARFGILD